MRKAKDHSPDPNRYYRPEVQHCPYCGRTLKRRYSLWDKYIVTWDGPLHVYNMAYSCPHRRCRGSHELFAAHAANQLSLKGSGFSVDIVTRVGWWRFWECRTLDEIHQQFQARRLPIARRHILNLLNDFLALLCAAQPLKLERHRPEFEQDGIIVSLDAMQPEKGNDQLFVAREFKYQLTLLAKNLASSRASEIQTHVLEPIRTLGFTVRAVVSDADDNIRRAVAGVWPDLPHQACQLHCACWQGQSFAQQGTSAYQHQMAADVERGDFARKHHCVVKRGAVRHESSGREDASGMSFDDARVHVARESEVVGVDQQGPH